MEVGREGGVPIKVWIKDMWKNLEPQAYQQAARVSRLPFIHKHVALMPDSHMGKGACVGSVIASDSAVVPSLVGVDIGCGMLAVKTNIKGSHLPESLKDIRLSIEAKVPVGHHCHKQIKHLGGLSWSDLSVYDDLSERVLGRALTQMGSLGSGNHFIELCLDENQDVWLMLHSGSRNIGKEVADIHINNAKGLMKRLYIKLEDPDLAYFAQGTKEYQNYLNDVLWCQEYAKQNRLEMYSIIIGILKKHFNFFEIVDSVVSCHHNYVSLENHYGKNVVVTRKGAIRARQGDIGIIPGSMGTKSYIVKGLGNKESFCSCSHGAGRAMSRSQAKKLFTIEDLKKQTEGVECRKDIGTLDEIPSAYKDIDVVMENQKDLVEVLHTLKQVMCVKG